MGHSQIRNDSRPLALTFFPSKGAAIQYGTEVAEGIWQGQENYWMENVGLKNYAKR